MKKHIYILMAALALTGCEDLLDTTNYTESNTGNFPSGSSDAEMMVTGVYATLNHATASYGSSYFYVAEFASDDRFAGGSEDDKSTLCIDKLLKANDTQFEDFWKIRYSGIARANSAIECLTGNDTFSDTSVRDQYLGEVHYLRAFFYSELVEMFGEVPLITSTSQETNVPRANIDEIYAQIASDLKQAISLMSGKPYSEYVSGHVTKWAAEALMARVYLFYTGFYGKDSLPLPSEGGSIVKNDVIAWIDDCIQNSGHSLVGDYRNLWAYTNKYTKDDYAYTKDVIGVNGQPLLWVGNENPETLFSVKYCNFGGWSGSWQMGYTNQYLLAFGMRGGNGVESTFPFGQGWGHGPVASTIWDEWMQAEPDDLRRKASILNVDDPTEEVDYSREVTIKQMEDCGLWNKKMIPISSRQVVDKSSGATVWPNTFWMADPEWDKSNSGNAMQDAHFQDLIVIRFADVLLMQSELKEDVVGINRVRARVGLAPLGAYSLESLQKERRHELCFEGRRWADIRRWGIAEQALSAQNGVTVYNKGERTKITDGGYQKRYQATKGFWPIPKAQIDLSEGVLTQNEGWKGTDANYSSWNF